MSFARVRALAVVSVLLVCAVIFVVTALMKDTQTRATAGSGEGCPPGYVPADLRLPNENKDIKINVYNATDRQGLAERVANEFLNREFTVVNKDTIKAANDPLKKSVDGIAALRYGPKSVGAAQVLRAYFLAVSEDSFVTEFDLKREDDVVDVVIGAKYRQLATPTEMRQALAALGNPQPPEGTCDGSPR